MNKKIKNIIFVFFLFGLTLFLAFNKHSKSGYFNYHSEIWGDKAGYYIYLPAAFIYDFQAHKFPEKIDSLTGSGFSTSPENDIVLTKYTYGVALLQSPFFIISHIIAPILDYERDGYSPVYQWSVNIASVFYLCLGLIFLYKFLKYKYDKWSSILATATIFLASNLFYYSIDETGMSHIYSFALFCIFLYFIRKTKFLFEYNIFNAFLFGLICGLILLVRPSNLLFLTCYFFLDAQTLKDLIFRLKNVLRIDKLIPLLTGSFLVILPQLIYWKYSSGSYFNYSYGEEGFNWLDPKPHLTLFSPDNGLLLYTPLFIVILVLAIKMVINKDKVGYYLIILFPILTYILSSWWSWDFGCSFGARSYVEYLSIFSIPLAFGFSIVKNSKKHLIVLLSTLVLLVIFNLKLTYSYDECYYGNGPWDWDWYINLVFSETK